VTGKQHPRRTCLGCRKTFDQDDLVRFVLSPDGSVLVDYRKKLPGRGGYTCLDPGCIARACQQGQFRRAFKSQAVNGEPAILLQELRGQLREKIDSLIGMARKAGLIQGGSQLVLSAMDHPQDLGLLILATDISAGVGEKVTAKAAAVGLPIWSTTTKDHLGALVGRSERSVLAIHAGQLCDRLQLEIHRFEQIAGEH